MNLSITLLVALLLTPLASLHAADAPALKPVTSDASVTIHPVCTDITHDSRNPTVLACLLARTKDGGTTWSPESVIARHPDCQPSHHHARRRAPCVLTRLQEVAMETREIGYHNVPKGWNFPRARHLRLSVSSFMENVGR